LDRRLPAGLRGRDGLPHLFRGLRLRVSIAGSSSTFALARAAHAVLRARRMRTLAKVATTAAPRGPSAMAAYLALPALHPTFLVEPLRRRAFDEALVADLKRAWPVEALVACSGGTGRALRDFNRWVQATHVLVPGVGREPVDGSVRPDMAKARATRVARSVPEGATLVSGERDVDLRRVLRREAERAGARFVDAAPRDAAAMPGLEVPTVLDGFLRSALGVGLSAAERVQAMARLQRRLRWQPSALAGLRWFDGSGLPNAASLRAALDHLGRAGPGPVRATAVVYVQPEHRREAAWLAPVLLQALQDGVLSHVCLAGARATVLAEELRHVPSTLFLDRRGTVDAVARTLAREGPGGGVVTLGDAAGPWPRMLAARLRREDAPPGVWVPPPDVADAPDAPVDLAIPQATVLRAPSMGRRPIVNVLGDLDPDLVRPALVAPTPATTAPAPRVVPAVPAVAG
jgi:hypothetical protein